MFTYITVLSLVSFFMILTGQGIHESFTTMSTWVRFLSWVNSLMSGQVTGMNEGFSTLLTCQWFFASMDLFQCLNTTFFLQGLLKLFTLTQLISSASSPIILMRTGMTTRLIRLSTFTDVLSSRSTLKCLKGLRINEIFPTCLMFNSLLHMFLKHIWFLFSLTLNDHIRRWVTTDVFYIHAAFINCDCRMTVCINSILWHLLVGLCTLTTVFIVTESLKDLNSGKTKMEVIIAILLLNK